MAVSSLSWQWSVTGQNQRTCSLREPQGPTTWGKWLYKVGWHHPISDSYGPQRFQFLNNKENKNSNKKNKNKMWKGFVGGRMYILCFGLVSLVWAAEVLPASKPRKYKKTAKEELRFLNLSWLEPYGLCTPDLSSYTPQINTSLAISYISLDSLVSHHTAVPCEQWRNQKNQKPHGTLLMAS